MNYKKLKKNLTQESVKIRLRNQMNDKWIFLLAAVGKGVVYTDIHTIYIIVLIVSNSVMIQIQGNIWSAERGLIFGVLYINTPPQNIFD